MSKKNNPVVTPYNIRWPAGNQKSHYHPREQSRRERARKLLEARAQRTPQQQWDEIDLRLGLLQGAFKERLRLFALMNSEEQEAVRNSLNNYLQYA